MSIRPDPVAWLAGARVRLLPDATLRLAMKGGVAGLAGFVIAAAASRSGLREHLAVAVSLAVALLAHLRRAPTPADGRREVGGA